MKTLPHALLLVLLATLPCAAAVTFVDIVPDYPVTYPGSGDSDYDIDFNQDGTVEVRFVVSANATQGFNAVPTLGTRIQSVPFGDPGSFFAYPIYAGQTVQAVPIGPASWVFDSSPGSTLSYCPGVMGLCFGYFREFFVGWVGVEFTLPDGIHYGVVEIEGWFGNGFVRSYAWETTPGVPITAPEPGRAVLMMIALLLALSQRRRSHCPTKATAL